MIPKMTLKNPFPLEEISNLDLGNADGHRDKLIEESFVETKSIKTFLLDNHSIITGPFGSGKSALFTLIKNKSEQVKVFENDLIVPIEEQIQFTELRCFAFDFFPKMDGRVTYQLLWKFQLCRRVCEEIILLENFPINEDERYLQEFINRTGGRGSYKTIVGRLKDLLEKLAIKIKAKVSDAAVDVEIAKQAEKTVNRIELNLDEVISRISNVINKRGFRRCTVIIDKIDKFVAGEDYETQRSFITALLEMEDDLYPVEEINLKIFLRSDLFERLDFSSLGPDKIRDNTLKLKWEHEDILRFISLRFFISLEKRGIWDQQDIIQSSNIPGLKLFWYERALKDKNTSVFKRFLAKRAAELFKKERNYQTLYGELDKAIINKLFEKNIIHEDSSGDKGEISCRDFLFRHFKDGNDSCTPRYLLIFLKELVREADHYYSENPLIEIEPVLKGDEWVWELFSSSMVYKSYLIAKEIYRENISKIEDQWTRPILEVINYIDKRKKFDYNWISKNISFKNETEAEKFMIYLQVIGFLKNDKYHHDIRKRTFELPVLYRPAVGNILENA